MTYGMIDLLYFLNVHTLGYEKNLVRLAFRLLLRVWSLLPVRLRQLSLAEIGLTPPGSFLKVLSFREPSEYFRASRNSSFTQFSRHLVLCESHRTLSPTSYSFLYSALSYKQASHHLLAFSHSNVSVFLALLLFASAVALRS